MDARIDKIRRFLVNPIELAKLSPANLYSNAISILSTCMKRPTRRPPGSSCARRQWSWSSTARAFGPSGSPSERPSTTIRNYDSLPGGTGMKRRRKPCRRPGFDVMDRRTLLSGVGVNIYTHYGDLGDPLWTDVRQLMTPWTTSSSSTPPLTATGYPLAPASTRRPAPRGATRRRDGPTPEIPVRRSWLP